MRATSRLNLQRRIVATQIAAICWLTFLYRYTRQDVASILLTGDVLSCCTFQRVTTAVKPLPPVMLSLGNSYTMTRRLCFGQVLFVMGDAKFLLNIFNNRDSQKLNFFINSKMNRFLIHYYIYGTTQSVFCRLSAIISTLEISGNVFDSFSCLRFRFFPRSFSCYVGLVFNFTAKISFSHPILNLVGQNIVGKGQQTYPSRG